MSGWDHLEDFLRYLRVERQLSPHTLRNYRLDLTQFLEFCAEHREGLSLAQVTYQDLRPFLAAALTEKPQDHGGPQALHPAHLLQILAAPGGRLPESGQAGPQPQAGKGPAPLPERRRGLSPLGRAQGRMISGPAGTWPCWRCFTAAACACPRLGRAQPERCRPGVRRAPGLGQGSQGTPGLSGPAGQGGAVGLFSPCGSSS